MRRLKSALFVLCLLGGTAARGDAMKPMTYPETRRDTVVETQFGEAIADPYRWLEGDVRSHPEVAAWVARENAVSQAYLAALPQREWFADRIGRLLEFERFSLPVKAGGRYFYTRNTGLQNQAQLFVRHGLRGVPKLLLDPNTWAGDAATALDTWKPSRDGKLLLYSVQDGGSDWRVLRLLDVASGTILSDEIRWAKFTHLEWIGSKGFVYSRFPAPDAAAAFQARNYNQALWYHRVGTSQDADELVFATPEHPEQGHAGEVTSDGHHLIISSSVGTDARHAIRVIDLKRRGPHQWPVRELVGDFANDWRLVEGMGSRLWFVSNWQAPRYRLMAIDLADHAPQWHELVAQSDATLTQGSIIGNKLILAYLEDASSRALVYDLAGKPAHAIALNDIGTASGFRGHPGDPETFYNFTSFNRPAAVYRLNLATGATEPFAEPELPFDPAQFTIEQRFYPSRDGTRIPMFLVRRKDIAEAGSPMPTLLYGYGGFDVSLTPSFSAARMAWLEAGGAFAMANLRGGGEYGKAWHDAGRLANKQNVFDDFIAAGEYLIAQKVTSAGGLAIQGGSNGGLLVGAVVNQRPTCSPPPMPRSGSWTCCASIASPPGAIGSMTMATPIARPTSAPCAPIRPIITSRPGPTIPLCW